MKAGCAVTYFLQIGTYAVSGGTIAKFEKGKSTIFEIFVLLI